MKKILFLVWVGMFLLAACGGMGGDTKNTSGKLEVSGVWARTGMQDGNSAAYMLIGNGLGAEDELLSASSEVANAVELHLSKMENGVMKMEKQSSVLLPANSNMELKPGSFHVMLIGLKQELKVGDTFTLTLDFKNHEDIILTVPVKDAANMGGSGMDGHMP